MLFDCIQQTDVTASAISCISLDLEQALKREGRLKEKVQELMKKLEKLREHEKNSEMRHQQSVSFVNELKKANRYNLLWYIHVLHVPCYLYIHSVQLFAVCSIFICSLGWF